MPFYKPLIFWTRKKIKGEFSIGNGTDSKYVEKIPQDIKVDQRIRDNFPQNEQIVIDDYLKLLDEVKQDLNEIDTELDNRLNDIEIAYDPIENPLLAESHKCKYCGLENAPNIITYKDIKNNEEIWVISKD